jgi:N-acetylmuramoyl-L-alanine amidase
MRRAAVPAAVVVAVLAAAAPAHATPREFEQAVPVVASAAASAQWHSPPLRAPRRFELLGASWRGGGGSVELRVRRGGARWSRWIATGADDPVWSGAADAYELRAARPPHGLRVRFVAVDRPAPAPRAIAASGLRPAIVPRSSWDPHDDCRPRTTAPAYGRVDFAIVHHTASIDGYGPRESPAIVLAICLFHRDGNGWNDIGYDLLVDRYGTVFEGRAGGVEQPVVGAQAQGWNDISTGVSAIGDYSSTPLPRVALRALARAIAWKLSLAGVPATGAIGEVSTGGPLNRWPAGARVRFQRISGHRDAGSTDCPGNALYAQLPALRTLVARLLPAPRELLTISPDPLPQQAGGPVALTGRLARADGSRPAGASIVLQQQLDGAWQDAATVDTRFDGIWSAALPLVRDGAVRALTADGAVVSASVPVTVRAGVRAHASTRHLRLGAPLELAGATTPAKARVRLVVERVLRSGRVRRLQSRVLAADAAGRYALALRLPTVGVYRLTVLTAADALNAAGSSRPLSVRVLRRR